MDTTRLTLLTVVAEAVLEDRLVGDLHALGATGTTVTTAHGRGPRGIRSGTGGEGNVRIEALVRPEVADRAFARLAEAYFPYYAVVAWVTDVGVLRGDKYA